MFLSYLGYIYLFYWLAEEKFPLLICKDCLNGAITIYPNLKGPLWKLECISNLHVQNACVCLCVCVSIRIKFIHIVFHYEFKAESWH